MSLLFEPFRVRGAVARNRVWASPMCTYASDDSGRANDFHLAHLGRFALGGVGTVVVEATAVSAQGRISARDLGLWDDAQVKPLRRVADLLRAQGAVPAIQLAHAGRRAGTAPPWDALFPTIGAAAEVGWPVVGPGPEPSRPGATVPMALTRDGIRAVVTAWAAAARRAARAGFELIELHGAHGYLLHSFLSPLANHRTDEYGGTRSGRMRLPLEVVRAVREAVGAEIALSYRLSAVDGVAGGWGLEDSVALGRALAEAGVDLLDSSSGGITHGRPLLPGFRSGFAYHAPYARELRARCGLPVVTVGLVTEAAQAEAVLRAGDADAVALGRELLADPGWTHRAAIALGAGDHRAWAPHAGWYLHQRQAELERLAAEGHTPMTRYGG